MSCDLCEDRNETSPHGGTAAAYSTLVVQSSIIKKKLAVDSYRIVGRSEHIYLQLVKNIKVHKYKMTHVDF